uniref:Uncharacterized protein n=1 Tax=Panagrolaimus davidi TaxID=227884 RepID=A0A914QAV2_9BILA
MTKNPILINFHFFSFLKAVEIALNKKNPSVCDQLTFRSTNYMPYNEAPFIDGDFLRELLAFSNPDEIMEGIAVPKSLQDENPGLSPGYIAFNYLRQLWSLH